MPQATVRIGADRPIGTVSPRLYGGFAEHLGCCCYGGIWVDRDSEIPNEGGFRKDALEAPIMTDGPAFWLSPTDHVLRMHTPHVGAEALPVTVEGDSRVSATATRRDGKTTVSIVNRCYRDANAVHLAGLSGPATAEAQNSAALLRDGDGGGEPALVASAQALRRRLAFVGR